MEIEKIIGFEALWESAMKCKRGVTWKDSVANYVLNAVPETAKLEKELHDGTYKERPHKYFTITYPKERAIMSISFRDRVYQRSLNDVGIYPTMEKSFIYDNCACQKDKGTDFARGRFKCHLQRFWRKHGTDGYCLKMDVRGYYPNMRHDVAKEVYRRKLDPEVYERAAEILDSFPGEKGFNPGSQIIQICGISVLDQIDHYIKERLRVKRYIRYMDDMMILVPDVESAEKIKADIDGKLGEIGFELHPDKTEIIPLKRGIMFLGFRFRLTETGRVVMTVDPERVKAIRKKLYRMAQKAKREEIRKEKVAESYMSWRNHAAKGDSWKLLHRMDTYYRNLWRDNNGESNQGQHGGDHAEAGQA